jgi:hypothetical protein
MKRLLAILLLLAAPAYAQPTLDDRLHRLETQNDQLGELLSQERAARIQRDNIEIIEAQREQAAREEAENREREQKLAEHKALSRAYRLQAMKEDMNYVPPKWKIIRHEKSKGEIKNRKCIDAAQTACFEVKP